MNLITIKDLKRSYGEGEATTHALRGVSLSIKAGEFVSIMGPSGSGKSTLLHILGSLERPSSGSYFFDGTEIGDYSEEEVAHIRNKRMGFIFQTFNLLPRASLLDNVKLPLLYSGVPETEWDKLAKDAIEAVGLSNRLSHRPGELSGGERQRVAIARALVNSPDVIFADEPTGNLDSVSGSQVMEIIDSLHKLGHTIILITHETYTAEYANRIIHLRDGKIESDETKGREHTHREFRK